MPFASSGGPHTSKMESVWTLEAVRIGTCEGTIKVTGMLMHLLYEHVSQAACYLFEDGKYYKEQTVCFIVKHIFSMLESRWWVTSQKVSHAKHLFMPDIFFVTLESFLELSLPFFDEKSSQWISWLFQAAFSFHKTTTYCSFCCFYVKPKINPALMIS